MRGKGPRRRLTPVDHFTLADLRATKKFDRLVREFYWRMYSDLEFQRSEIIDDIRKALLRAALEKHEFRHYQRALKYRWTLKPLSAGGSLGVPGGRFNIGKVDSAFAPFPALYLAVDKETALQEVLGQDASDAAFNAALAKPDSISVVSVSGCIRTVLDLTQPDRLEPFVRLIRGFHLSQETRRLGKELANAAGKPAPVVVTKLSQLMESLLSPTWRELPVQLGIPDTTQIFGKLASEAGIEGIVYPSKFNARLSLAVFPQSFAGSASWLELDDPTPRKDVKRRLDRDSWHSLSK